MRHTVAIGLLAILLAACSATDALDEGADLAALAATASYQVTITNLTDGQPLTPPVVATHRPALELFRVGAPASFEVKEVAENGNLGPLVALVGDSKHVGDSVVAVAGDPPPLLPGQSVTFTIDSSLGAKYLSFVAMLICTNDGFTGIDSLFLPQQVGASVTVTTNAYDAGSEINTESFADIVPPCPVLTGVPTGVPGSGASDPALAEGGVIHPHPGVEGGHDLLVDLHGWDDPVARVEIVRVD